MANFEKPVFLLLKCAVMLVFVTLSYSVLLYATFDRTGQDYLAANLDKMRLVRETSSPKMIFIGGSNLAFGLDSAKIKQAVAMPVINMGVHAGFGLKFMLDQVTPYLKQGDIVVVVPEYQQFTNDLFNGDQTLFGLATCTNELSPLRTMSVTNLANSFLQANGAIFNYKPGHVHKPSTGVYARTSFNRDGDVTAHLTLPNGSIAFNAPLNACVDQLSVKYLHDFVAGNTVRGVTTMVVYPCLKRDYYLRNIGAVESVAKALSENGVQVTSSPIDFVYDDNLFYDTIYHLNAKGRTLRTEKMIQILGNALPMRVVDPFKRASL